MCKRVWQPSRQTQKLFRLPTWLWLRTSLHAINERCAHRRCAERCAHQNAKQSSLATLVDRDRCLEELVALGVRPGAAKFEEVEGWTAGTARHELISSNAEGSSESNAQDRVVSAGCFS